MSKENVRLFFEQVANDEILQKKVARLSNQANEKLTKRIVELATEAGYTFSREEMNELAVEQLATLEGSDELSEPEIEAITGGFSDLRRRQIHHNNLIHEPHTPTFRNFRNS